MYQYRLPVPLISVRYDFKQRIQQKRNIQVSILGAANHVGTNLALKLKQNPKITKLKLYDFQDKVIPIAKDLDQLPGGPPVTGYTGSDLKLAITMSDLILLVYNSTHAGAAKHEIAVNNAPAVGLICRAISERNPDALLGISTKPINSMVPFACAMLNKYNCFNPFKVFGMATIDVARAKSFAAQALRANPRHLTIPVIGGRSDETAIPLFSNLMPRFYCFDGAEADKLTRLVRKADKSQMKRGVTPPSLALSWSLNEGTEKVVDALCGAEVELHCYSANPGFGTRFFAAPVIFGSRGITHTFNNFNLNALECNLLSASIRYINKDIAIGEKLARQYD